MKVNSKKVGKRFYIRVVISYSLTLCFTRIISIRLYKVLIKLTFSSRLTKKTLPKKQTTRKEKSRTNISRTSNQQSHALQEWTDCGCHTNLFEANVSVTSVQILYTIQHNMQSLHITATKVIGSQFNTIKWNVIKVI